MRGYPIITVRARKRSDCLLEGEGKYYRLSKPDKWFDNQWSMYVLRRVNEESHPNPKYEIISAYNI